MRSMCVIEMDVKVGLSFIVHAHLCLTSSIPTGHLFEHVPKNRWKHHAQEKCPHCQGDRFKTIIRNNKEFLEPVSWYIDFGLQNQWLALFQSPEFNQHRGQHRSMEPGSFWSSKEAERLRVFAQEHELTNEPNGFPTDFSPFELGIDWLEPWNSVKYSMGLVILRNCDTEDRNLGKKFNSCPVILVPGPKAPPNTSPYLIKSCKEALHLAMTGVQVEQKVPSPAIPLSPSPTPHHPGGEPAAPTEGGEHAPAAAEEAGDGPGLPDLILRSFLHRAFLIGLFADTQAR